MTTRGAADGGRSYRTFRDWGLAVPFTTPALSHVRLRPGRHGRLELLLRNPSGGKGVYIVDLGSVGELFTLSLHDRLLVERLQALPAPTPESIRQAARELATEGAAGRAARRACESEAAELESTRLLIELHLLGGLLRAVGAGEIDWRRLHAGETSFRSYIRGKLAEVAPQVGVGRDELLTVLEQIGEASAHVGVASAPWPSRNERRLAALSRLASELAAWSLGGAADDLAQRIAAIAERTLTPARAAHEAACELLDDPVRLVRLWRDDNEKPRELLGRSDWLLDGWAQACPLWEAAAREERAAQAAVVERIGLLIPFLDRTDLQEGSIAVHEERTDIQRRVRLHQDWRTGLMLIESMARSEALRAAAAA